MVRDTIYNLYVTTWFVLTWEKLKHQNPSLISLVVLFITS